MEKRETATVFFLRDQDLDFILLTKKEIHLKQWSQIPLLSYVVVKIIRKCFLF